MATTALPPSLRPRRVPRQQRSAETRARILDAARRTFETHGYAHGTTNRIAEAAGISVGSLYQYFPNKDAILVELVDLHIATGSEAVTAAVSDAMSEAPSHGPREGPVPLDRLVRGVAGALVDLHGTDRRLHQVLFEEAPRPAEQLARLRQLEQDLTGWLADLLTDHPEVRVPDVRRSARIVIDTIESLVHRIGTDGESGISDAELVDEITRLVTAYLGAR